MESLGTILSAAVGEKFLKLIDSWLSPGKNTYLLLLLLHLLRLLFGQSQICLFMRKEEKLKTSVKISLARNNLTGEREEPAVWIAGLRCRCKNSSVERQALTLKQHPTLKWVLKVYFLTGSAYSEGMRNLQEPKFACKVLWRVHGRNCGVQKGRELWRARKSGV